MNRRMPKRFVERRTARSEMDAKTSAADERGGGTTRQATDCRRALFLWLRGSLRLVRLQP